MQRQPRTLAVAIVIAVCIGLIACAFHSDASDAAKKGVMLVFGIPAGLAFAYLIITG